MQRIISILIFLFACSLSWGTACPAGYTITYKVAVLPQGYLSGNITSYTAFFSGSDTGNPTGVPGLRSVGNGGFVQDATNAKDIVVCDAASSGNVISYDMVPGSYDPVHGTFELYFLAPVISKTTNQFVYLQVGHSSPTDFSCNLLDTAACGTALYPNCLLVYHMNTTGFVDSCGLNTATNHSVTTNANTVFPPIYNYGGFNLQYFDSGLAPGSLANYSLEYWIEGKDASTNHFIAGYISTQAFNPGLDLFTETGGSAPCTGSGVCTTIAANNLAGLQQLGNCEFNINGISFVQQVYTHASGGSILCYGNGSSQTIGVTGTSVTPAGTGTFQVGNCGPFCGAPNWTNNNGLDELRLLSAVLSADQVAFDYTNQIAPNTIYTLSAVSLALRRDRGQIF